MLCCCSLVKATPPLAPLDLSQLLPHWQQSSKHALDRPEHAPASLKECRKNTADGVVVAAQPCSLMTYFPRLAVIQTNRHNAFLLTVYFLPFSWNLSRVFPFFCTVSRNQQLPSSCCGQLTHTCITDVTLLSPHHIRKFHNTLPNNDIKIWALCSSCGCCSPATPSPQPTEHMLTESQWRVSKDNKANVSRSPQGQTGTGQIRTRFKCEAQEVERRVALRDSFV